MAALFVRLRIAGFKSFAEAATNKMLPGLTGVVGPNGCGKSNVSEALCWAMDVGVQPCFAGHPERQVVRRIERGVGSGNRVNGREARARDVQTLFADLASEARSSAIISPGRVAAIVAAPPDERRMVLEQAAGITGLHGRRAEGELRKRSKKCSSLPACRNATDLAAFVHAHPSNILSSPSSTRSSNSTANGRARCVTINELLLSAGSLRHRRGDGQAQG